MKFGSTIKLLRNRKGLNQQVLADRIGVTQTYLSLLESNQKTPSINLINSFSREFNIPASILAYLTLDKKEVSKDFHTSFDRINPLIEDLIQQMLQDYENI